MSLAALTSLRPIAAILFLCASSFCAVAQDERKNPLEGKPDAIDAGRQLYSNTCLFCHGANGLGARAPNLVEGLFRPDGGADDGLVFDIILKGRPNTLMGGFEGTYSEQEIWQVISYLRSEGAARASKKAK